VEDIDEETRTYDDRGRFLLAGGTAGANAQWSLSNGFRGIGDATAQMESDQYFSPDPRNMLRLADS
jgi:hypothetical protein